MEVASQHWTDWTDWTDWNTKILMSDGIGWDWKGYPILL